MKLQTNFAYMSHSHLNANFGVLDGLKNLIKGGKKTKSAVSTVSKAVKTSPMNRVGGAPGDYNLTNKTKVIPGSKGSSMTSRSTPLDENNMTYKKRPTSM